jgi:hypothetical protein
VTLSLLLLRLPSPSWLLLALCLSYLLVFFFYTGAFPTSYSTQRWASFRNISFNFYVALWKSVQISRGMVLLCFAFLLRHIEQDSIVAMQEDSYCLRNSVNSIATIHCFLIRRHRRVRKLLGLVMIGLLGAGTHLLAAGEPPVWVTTDSDNMACRCLDLRAWAKIKC